MIKIRKREDIDKILKKFPSSTFLQDPSSPFKTLGLIDSEYPSKVDSCIT